MPDLRLALVHAVRSVGLSVAETARRNGVIRKTSFKWLAGHDAETGRPLADRSRRPACSPSRTPEDAERAVLEARDRWGWPVRVDERAGQVEVYSCAHRVRCLSEAGLRRDTMM